MNISSDEEMIKLMVEIENSDLENNDIEEKSEKSDEEEMRANIENLNNKKRFM